MSEEQAVELESTSTDAPIVDSSTTPESATETAVQPEGQQEEPKKVNKVQERINQLTREKYEARQETAALEQRIRDLEANKPESKEPELIAPQEDDFEDYTQYQSANAEFVAKTAANAAYERISAENKRNEEAAQATNQQQALETKKKAFDENVSSKKGNFEDFDNVAYGHQFMDLEMAERLFDMDKGPEVAYHLGSHLDVAEKIFSLDPVQRAIELTKLEFQVEALKPKVVSDAPDPITPLGNSEVVSKSEEDMSDSEWLSWRNNQINARNSK
jgi:hypothetical protein